VKLETSRFGTSTSRKKGLSAFPPDCTGFRTASDTPFLSTRRVPLRLVSVGGQWVLAFVLIDPLLVKPDYEVRISLKT